MGTNSDHYDRQYQPALRPKKEEATSQRGPEIAIEEGNY